MNDACKEATELRVVTETPRRGLRSGGRDDGRDKGRSKEEGGGGGRCRAGKGSQYVVGRERGFRIGATRAYPQWQSS